MKDEKNQGETQDFPTTWWSHPMERMTEVQPKPVTLRDPLVCHLSATSVLQVKVEGDFCVWFATDSGR